MFNSPRRGQPVHKTGLMHLPAISGNDMHKFNHLMHDTRSEFSKNIKTYNMSINASMNRHLSQALRDVNANIHTLNRSQQTTYGTMCQIVDTQRRRLKETYKHYQDNLRNDSKASRRTNSPNFQIKRKAVHGKKLPPMEQNQEPQATEVGQDKPDEIVTSTDVRIASVPKQSTGLMETTNPALAVETVEDKPIDSESIKLSVSENNDREKQDVQTSLDEMPLESSSPKLLLNFPCRSSTKKAFFTASLRPMLPPINESIDNDGYSQRKAGRAHNGMLGVAVTKGHHPYFGSNKAGSSIGRGSDSPDQSINETVVSAQKATSLRARIADLEKQHMQEFLRKQNLETKPKPYEAKANIRMGSDSHTMSSSLSTLDKGGTGRKVSRSIAVERRRLAKLRAAHRKAVLNSENSYQFIQLSDGSFLQGATAYTRKRFLPPSNRAQYERDQILKSEAAKMEINDEKIGAFFNKLDLPPPAEATKKVLKRKDTKSKIKLSDIEPVLVEEPVKRENSVVKPLTEIAKDVAYIREYIRPADRPDYILQNTSWSQKY